MKKLLLLAPAILLGLSTVATAQSMMSLPAFTNTYSYVSHTRGFWFDAPTGFMITSLQVPDEAKHGKQMIAVYNMGPGPHTASGLPTAANLKFYSVGTSSAAPLPCSVLINKGDRVAILGACGDATATNNSYGAGGHISSVLGNPATLARLTHQFNLVPSKGLNTLGYATAGSIGRVNVWITPQKGLYAGFDADKKIGAGPFTVQFTDKTFTSDPGGVKTWAWDLNGDTKIDSTVQNPKFVYPSIMKTATYDVTLTVTDASNPSSSITKKAFITVDPKPVAAFSVTPSAGIAPLPVQFTDMSVGANAWAWDFNNDTVVDSTLQNPKFVYGPGTFSVKLTVSNNGGSAFVLKNNLISVIKPGMPASQPDMLQYQFNEVRTNKVCNTASGTTMPKLGTASTSAWQTDAGRGGFKSAVKGTGCLGNSTNVNTGWPVSVKGNMTIMFWYRLRSTTPASTSYFFGNGTFRCFTGGVAATSFWYRGTPIGDIKATYNVQNQPGKWVHCALVIDDGAGSAKWYFNGALDSTTLFTPSTHTYTATTNMIVGGSASSPKATDTYDLDDFRMYGQVVIAPRIIVELSQEVASAGEFDLGCGGAKIGGNGIPNLGNTTFSVQMSGAPTNASGVLLIGTNPTQFATFPLPFDVSFLFGAGCKLHTDILMTNNFLTDASGNGKSLLPIPPVSALEGAHLYGQSIIVGGPTTFALTQGLDLNLQK